jgi:carbamoyl-phosphate synthase large subunit
VRILVTAAGGDIAQAAIRVIRSTYPDFTIVGIDAKLQPFFSKFCDEFLVAPESSNQNYISWINTLCNTHQIDLIIPLSEPEIELLSNSRRKLIVNHISANPLALSIGLDKLKTVQFLIELGDYAPNSSEVLSENLSAYPVVIKERRGRGSRDVRICKDFEEASTYFKLMKQPLVQELLYPSDQEITCAIYRFVDGETRIIQLLRHLSGGRTLWATVIQNDEITRMCELIASSLALVGSINIQLILTESGPKVFEINSRYSSTIEMRHEVGFEDLVWGLDEALGLPKRNYFEPRRGTLVGRRDQVFHFLGNL